MNTFLLIIVILELVVIIIGVAGNGNVLDAILKELRK